MSIRDRLRLAPQDGAPAPREALDHLVDGEPEDPNLEPSASALEQLPAYGTPDSMPPAGPAAVQDVVQDQVVVRAEPVGSVELESESVDRPVQVEARVGVYDEQYREILPGWSKSLAGWRAWFRWQRRKQWHAARWYGVRLPLVCWRAVLRTPRGTWRAARWVAGWMLDARGNAMEQALTDGGRGEVKDWYRVREQRAARVRTRTGLFLAVLAAVSVVGWLLVDRGPLTLQAAVVLVLVFVLAKVGSDPSRPLVGSMVIDSGRYRELTDAIVMRALRAAGLGGTPPKFDNDGNEVQEDTRPTLAAPIARSANQRGYEVLADLPFGKTAGDAAAAIEKIASGLDVDIAQVFVEPVAGKARRASFYVADEDPMLLPAHRSALARLPRVSVWDPQPLARTPIGRQVDVTLVFNSFLLGAVPRVGKSWTAKCLMAPAVLDPYCDLTVLDCGGGRDWLPTREIAVNHVAGDDEEDLIRIITILEQLRAEARERLAEFRTMSSDEMPEDKLTRELARAGMLPHPTILDEAQNLLRASNKDIRKLALEVLTWMAKTAPKAGYPLITITQRPAATVIDPDLRDVHTVRIALRTKTRQGSDAILGSDISATGFRTDRFLESHKGAAVIGGIPTGKGGDLQVVRIDKLTPHEFARACTVGRQRRIDAGTLRGQAAGDELPVQVTVTVLSDVHAVWPGSTAKVQAHVLLGRLREVFGDRYAGLDETALTRALKGHQVPAVQVYRDGINRNGYALADVARAYRALGAGPEHGPGDGPDET